MFPDAPEDTEIFINISFHSSSLGWKSGSESIYELCSPLFGVQMFVLPNQVTLFFILWDLIWKYSLESLNCLSVVQEHGGLWEYTPVMMEQFFITHLYLLHVSPLATSGYNQSLIAGIVLIGWICTLLVARRQNSSGVFCLEVLEVSQGVVILFTPYSRVGMLKPSPRGWQCNPSFLSYRVDNLGSLSPQLKLFSARGGQKTRLIAAHADWVSTATITEEAALVW